VKRFREVFLNTCGQATDNLFSLGSASDGVVTFEKPLESAEEMINKADELMYDVKRQGKNSILSVNA
jgi:PleD family two-component response regulator